MKIAEFLREDLILPDLQATDKAGVLRELCTPLARAYGLDPGRLTEVLLEREKLGSTGVGEGVAIPHGKLPGVPNLLAAFGRSKRGVDFAAIDGKPTYLFFVLGGDPPQGAGADLAAVQVAAVSSIDHVGAVWFRDRRVDHRRRFQILIVISAP